MVNLSSKLVSIFTNNTINNISADKSISHRAVIFSALARGNSTISNLLLSLDINNTINAFKLLGVEFTFKNSICYIKSPGFGNYVANSNNIVVDLGNSGTSARLLSAIFSSNLFYNSIKHKQVNFTLVGDESLQKRPMLRIIEPLQKMGAKIKFLTSSNTLPIQIQPCALTAINIDNVFSAQVKSALMLAGLFANGVTNIKLNTISRDHTEKIFTSLGINYSNNNNLISIVGNPSLIINNYNYNIPADFSSASFFIALGLITPGANFTINNVNINSTRTGLLTVLKTMQANITISNVKNIGEEEVGDITVKYSNLIGCNVNKSVTQLMIDEYPILAIIALFAKGKTTFNNIEELRYKESDRITSITKNFTIMGFKYTETKDSLTIHGLQNLNNNTIVNNSGVILNSFLDHRIAMSMLVLASRCINNITVLNCNNINTSFPNFIQTAQQLNWAIYKE